jgi:hypothetical protein
MRSPKQTVRVKCYLNGAPSRSFEERRVIYTRKDGTQFIRDWQGQKPLSIDVDGVPFYELHARSIQVVRFA